MNIHEFNRALNLLDENLFFEFQKEWKRQFTNFGHEKSLESYLKTTPEEYLFSSAFSWILSVNGANFWRHWDEQWQNELSEITIKKYIKK